MEKTAEVKVNFFKPTTGHAKANMKLILILAITWAIAVFGFQVLLILLNKPVPEPNYTKFDQLWPGVVDGTKSVQAKQDFAKVTLSVLGKNVALTEPHREVLKTSLSKLILDLLPTEQKQSFSQAPSEFLANNDLHQVLGLSTAGMDKISYDLLPTSLTPVKNANFTPELTEQIPEIMQLYLVHNRSVLTDARFLGFPFHYWYTAQFLLILFVGLCIIYASFIDRLHKKYNIEQ